jgi:hypothetical protein
MHYSLSDGRVVIMDVDTYLSYPDNIHQLLLADFDGEYITNPFHGSVLRKHSILEDDTLLSLVELDEISSEEKLIEVKDDLFIDH